jgi:L,D-transpeptidase ErfK/SrfK
MKTEGMRRWPTAVLLLTLLGLPDLTGGQDGLAQDAQPDDLQRQRYHQLRRDLQARQQVATPYLIVDTRANRVHLRDRQHRLERDAVCATGAARRFEGPKAWKHDWLFATPTGRFEVLRKVTDPIWTRPEWDFLEADEEIPVFAEDPRRFQRGILGRYAIYFRKDIMIHGTLYEVNLGRNITHGCVRVGAEDLAFLFERVETGWPVYVF